MTIRYWLFKSEPSTFSIDDLANAPQKTTGWEGVRNYQARNFLRDEVKKGDKVFFYHSSCPQPAIVGIAEVVREGYPDPTAFDATSPYYDPKSTIDNPRWFRVDIKLKDKFPQILSLAALRENPKLASFTLLQKGNRLSVMPLTAEQWQTIIKMI
jgi:predicted RNA-binding protein with PUA-like domain